MNNDALDQLKQYFGERFDAIDKRFEKLEKRLDGVDKRLEHMDKRTDERFAAMTMRLDLMDASLSRERKERRTQNSRILSTLDKIYRQQQDDDLERAALQSQVERHDKWIEQVASHLELKLDYDA